MSYVWLLFLNIVFWRVFHFVCINTLKYLNNIMLNLFIPFLMNCLQL